MQKIIILGSTGNLGTQSLEVLQKYQKKFEVIGLTCFENTKLLSQQVKELGVNHTGIGANIDITEADIVINTMAGVSGIEATKQALKSNKTVILANKESLIAEGKEIMSLAAEGQLIPMDSEHNAISEIIRSRPAKKVHTITIPCSGGPFLHKSKKNLQNITATEALKHPKWNMGAKISIESATLINKGMEVLEAHFLFQIPLEKIQVKVHPECHIHGIVEFEDGEKLAYISPPDMKEHIENCLRTAAKLEPNCEDKIHPFPSEKTEKYELLNPDHETFPGIKLVLQAFQQGRIKEFLQNEEKIIARFLKNEFTFLEIFEKLAE